MRVLGDRILVKVSTSETKTESGIILAAMKAERKYEGEVVGVGDHEDIKKTGIKIGDYVFYTPGTNIEMPRKQEDEDILDAVSIYDVVAVAEKEE